VVPGKEAISGVESSERHTMVSSLGSCWVCCDSGDVAGLGADELRAEAWVGVVFMN
jgi:hypothetical protein